MHASALPAADTLVGLASFNVLELSRETTVKSKVAACQSRIQLVVRAVRAT